VDKHLRPVGLNRSIADEILAIERSIDAHQRALRIEGSLLFVTVLGCWSVTPGCFRAVALLAALILFGQNYSSYGLDQRDFPKQFVAARKRISALPVEQHERQDGLIRLEDAERERLGGLRPFYKVPGFVIGWGAFIATVLDTYITIAKGLT